MVKRTDQRRRIRTHAVFASTAAAFVLVPTAAHAQLGRSTTPDTAESTTQIGLTETQLSKGFQNPTGDLLNIPVPVTGDLGENGRTRYSMSANPFIPVNLTEDVRLIARAVVPITSAPIRTNERAAGLGDTSASFMFAPNRNRDANFAIGPTTTLPTATSRDLGSQKWSVGPAVAVSATAGPWVYGGVASYNWSVAGVERRKDVSAITLQPFAYYNFTDGWAVGTSPTATANFAEPVKNMLTLPIGGGVYKVLKPDPNNALSLSVQAYANPIRPDNGPDAQVRFVLAGLFPQ
jgi:hypothetical protein